MEWKLLQLKKSKFYDGIFFLICELIIFYIFSDRIVKYHLKTMLNKETITNRIGTGNRGVYSVGAYAPNDLKQQGKISPSKYAPDDMKQQGKISLSKYASDKIDK